MKTRLAFFDFDNTLSRGDSVVPFLLYAVRKRIAPPSQLLRAVRGYLHQLRHPDQVSYSKSIAFSFIKGRRQEEIDALKTALDAGLINALYLTLSAMPQEAMALLQ